MVNCDYGQEDITSQKTGAKIGMSIMTVIYIFFIAFLIVRYKSKGIIVKQIKAPSPTIPANSGKTFTERFNILFNKATTSINLGMIVALLCSSLALGFNAYIMTPVVSLIFPYEAMVYPIPIPGTIYTINPGQFFIALVGFIITLILFFFIVEFFYYFAKYIPYEKLFVIIIFVFFTFMFIWNIMNTSNILSMPDCVDNNTKLVTFSNKKMGNGKSDNASISINNPSLGSFV